MLLRRQAVTPPDGRAQRPGGAARAGRAGSGVEKGFPTDPEEVFEELRRASAGGPADYSGITYRRHRGRRTGCSGRARRSPTGRRRGTVAGAIPARRGSSSTGSPPPTGGPGSSPVDAPAGRRGAGRGVSGAADDRAGASPSTSPGAQTRRVDELNAAAPGPFVELHPRLAARLGAAEGDPLAVVSRRGRAVAPARITTGDPARHRLHAVPLAGRGPGQHADQPGPRPDVADAGVQGVRGAGGARCKASRVSQLLALAGWPACRRVRMGSRVTGRPAREVDPGPYGRWRAGPRPGATSGPPARRGCAGGPVRAYSSSRSRAASSSPVHRAGAAVTSVAAHRAAAAVDGVRVARAVVRAPAPGSRAGCSATVRPRRNRSWLRSPGRRVP